MQYIQFCVILFVVASNLFGNGTMISQISKLLIVSAAIYSISLYGYRKVSWLFVLWYCAFMALCIISMSWALFPAESRRMLTTVMYAQISGLSLYVLICNKMSLFHLTIKTFVFSSILLFLRFISIYGFNFNTDIRASEEMEMSINTIGMVCAFACIFSYYYYNKERKTIWLLFSIVLLFMSVLSGSRKAILLPPIAWIVLQLSISNFSNITKRVIYIGLFVGIAFILLMENPYLYELGGRRLESMFRGLGSVESSSDVDASTTTRARLLELGWILYYKSPVYGLGIHAFKQIHGTLYSHNNYMEIMVSFGIIGIFVYYSVYLIVLVKLFVKIRKFKDELSAFLFSVIIGLLALHYGFVAYYSLMNSILLSICGSYAFNNSSNKNLNSKEYNHNIRMLKRKLRLSSC